jgi:hypothetical protein
MTGGEQWCQVFDLSDSIELFSKNGHSFPGDGTDDADVSPTGIDISLKGLCQREMIKPKERAR